MTREETLKEIDEVIKYNKAARGAEVTELFKDATRKSNDVLAHVRRYIGGYSEYERGLNDAWELAKKIDCYPIDGGWGYDELHVIFDSYNTSEIFKNHTYQEALVKVKEYEKKKEEAAKKPKIGDMVSVMSPLSGSSYTGIFLGQDKHVIYVMEKDRVAPSAFKDDSFVIEKTGEHVDILGALKGE